MYFHNSLIPRGAYFLLPLESKQEATLGWNFTKYISDVKVNQLKVKNMHVKMGISTFKEENTSPMKWDKMLAFTKILIFMELVEDEIDFLMMNSYTVSRTTPICYSLKSKE